MNKRLKYILPFVSLLFLLRIFFFEIYSVTQNSMRNTYQEGSKVFISKRFYSISVNNILLFKHENQILIKRCVGLPGDTIEISEDKIYNNRKLLPTPPNVILNSTNEYDAIIRSKIYITYGSNWTPSNFGLYVIPKKGLKILLTPLNIAIYGNLINNDSVTTQKTSSLKKHNKEYYVFQNDYIFFIGDNRPESTDSRIFGPIKVSDIKGKVILKLL